MPLLSKNAPVRRLSRQRRMNSGDDTHRCVPRASKRSFSAARTASSVSMVGMTSPIRFSAHIRARISGYSGAVTRGTAVHPSETYAAGAISGHMSVVYTRACGKCRCRDSLNARTSATRLPAEVIRMLVFTLI